MNILIYLYLFVYVVSCQTDFEQTQAEVQSGNEDFSDSHSVLGISPDELKLRMEVIFEVIGDKQDHLTRQQILNWLYKVQHQISQRQVKLEMDSIDKNKDGLLSREELIQAYIEVDGVDEADQASRTEELDLRIKIVDKDGDGQLTAEELGYLVHPYLTGPDSEIVHVEAREVIKQQDKDNDGLISITEFLGSEQEDDENHAQYTSEFELYDLNRDGFLDFNEIRKIMGDPHGHEMRTAADDIMKHAANSDFISKDEFITHINEFSMGRLTDHGELLRSPSQYDLNFPFSDIEESPEEVPEEAHDEL